MPQGVGLADYFGRAFQYGDLALQHVLTADGKHRLKTCVSIYAETIMQRAVSYASIDVLKFIIEHGGLIRERDLVARASFDHNNDEPGCLEVVRFLLDLGAPIDAYFAEDTIEAEKSCLNMFMGRQNALHFAQDIPGHINVYVFHRPATQLHCSTFTLLCQRPIT